MYFHLVNQLIGYFGIGIKKSQFMLSLHLSESTCTKGQLGTIVPL